MTFELLSTVSWNIIGTFDEVDTAREAVRVAVDGMGIDIHELELLVSDDDGERVEELSDADLARWAGMPAVA
jgi:hypothetical protein